MGEALVEQDQGQQAWQAGAQAEGRYDSTHGQGVRSFSPSCSALFCFARVVGSCLLALCAAFLVLLRYLLGWVVFTACCCHFPLYLSLLLLLSRALVLANPSIHSLSPQAITFCDEIPLVLPSM